MKIETVREILASKIPLNEEWIDKLNNSEPGHYGVEDWDVNLSHDDIWVDMQQKTFSFKNAQFEFTLMIGGSNPENGSEMSFTKEATGKGTFDFIGPSPKNDVEVEDLELNFDLDLFGE